MNRDLLHIEVLKIVRIGQKVDPIAWTQQDILSKLFEEGGEFSRAIQIKIGKINREQPDYEDFDECADVIICAVDALARANGLHNMLNDENNCIDQQTNLFIKKLAEALSRKSAKWEKKIIRK
jgi:NTP pyrophosphatase (non-canonical NTP hydrolase)